jgi:hypothetical protein
MSATKLTLLVDKHLVERAKRFSRSHKTSISRLVTRYLEGLATTQEAEPTPMVRRLTGLLPPGADVAEHGEHLRRKHKL